MDNDLKTNGNLKFAQCVHNAECTYCTSKYDVYDRGLGKLFHAALFCFHVAEKAIFFL